MALARILRGGDARNSRPRSTQLSSHRNRLSSRCNRRRWATPGPSAIPLPSVGFLYAVFIPKPLAPSRFPMRPCASMQPSHR